MPGRIADRYVVERELGRGATSIVYLARDVDLGRMVAVKVLRQELTESLAAERFLKEIKLTAQLHHPNIVPVLASGVHEGRLYFVLPYMDGGTLRERMARDKQLPIEDVVKIGVTIAGALAFAHERNLLHRDVKPENILFTNGEACLSDFGIAKAITRASDESTTTTGLVRGTPAYMSPEQASGDHDYDGRSDLYSLACVLYEALAGIPAFVGATPQAVVAQRITHEPRSIRVYRPSVTPGLEAVLRKALAIVPGDRYQTADELRRALLSADSAPRRPPRQRAMLAGAATATLVIGYFAVRTARDVLASGEASEPLDTTVVAVLPAEGADTAAASQVTFALTDQLRRWRGVSVADAFKLTGDLRASESNADARAAETAIQQRAGRFTRTRLTQTGELWRVSVTLYDTKQRSRLHEAAISVPQLGGSSESAIRSLMDSVLLRGAAISTSSRVLPAVQHFNAALTTIGETWDLRRADSLLSRALQEDPSLDEASLWLAEVRAAGFRPLSTWRAAAERASIGQSFTPRERELGRALAALARMDFVAGCGAFERMRSMNARDFIAQYGLGLCRQLDTVVVRDRRSPSGWAFRSSANQAAIHFAEAFKMAPALHRGVEASGFALIRRLLWTNDFSARRGTALAPETVQFIAQPEWRGDSLAFVPYPIVAQASAANPSNAAARLEALRHQRTLFADLARSWAGAFPTSAATKEALAIALEMNGDRAAVDTVRVARRLASDELTRVQLAAHEVFLRLEFAQATSTSTADVSAARNLADSLLRFAPTQSPDFARVLAPLGALLGRCSIAAHHAATAARTAPSSLDGDIDSVSARFALGCGASIPAYMTVYSADSLPRTAIDSAKAEYGRVGRLASLTFPADSARVIRLAAAVGDYMLRAQAAAHRRDSAVTTTILLRQFARRGFGITRVSPDARYFEARAWLAIKDTAHARLWLQPLFDRSVWSTSVAYDAIAVGSIIRGRSLAAALQGDTDPLVVEWRRTLGILWQSADPELRAAREFALQSR